MKYLYIFKKTNGEIFLEEETLAYKHIYQNENYREPFQYIGRIQSDIYLTSLPDIQGKLKEFKDNLLKENPTLQKTLENGAVTGAFTPLEQEYAEKINVFSKQMEQERAEALLSLAKKEYPDKNLNISTPGGNRDLIINSIR